MQYREKRSPLSGAGHRGGLACCAGWTLLWGEGGIAPHRSEVRSANSWRQPKKYWFETYGKQCGGLPWLPWP